MEKKYLFFVFNLLQLDWYPGVAFPDGPPISTCLTMIPNHSVQPETSPSPYLLSANTNCFNPGQRILLTLQDVTGEEDDFRGLFVQARLRNGLANSHGTFDTNGDPDLKAVNCFGGFSNSIGHSNNENKYVKTFGWTSPMSGITGPIVFKYTVVEDFSDFWVGLELELPQCGASDSTPKGGSDVPHPPFGPATPPLISNLPPDITIVPLMSTNKPPSVSNGPFVTNPSVHPRITPVCDDESDILCQDLNRAKCQLPEMRRRCCESCEDILSDTDAVDKGHSDGSSDSSSADHSDKRRNNRGEKHCPGGDFYPVCSQLPKLFCRQYLKECCISCRL